MYLNLVPFSGILASIPNLYTFSSSVPHVKFSHFSNFKFWLTILTEKHSKGSKVIIPPTTVLKAQKWKQWLSWGWASLEDHHVSWYLPKVRVSQLNLGQESLVTYGWYSLGVVHIATVENAKNHRREFIFRSTEAFHSGHAKNWVSMYNFVLQVTTSEGFR